MTASMNIRKETLNRLARWLVPLALALACPGAAPLDRPDAVIVVDPEPRVLFSLFPLLAHLENPPLLVHMPGNEAYVVDHLNQMGAKRVWLIDPAKKAPEGWRKKFQVWEGNPASIALSLVQQSWSQTNGVVVWDGREPELAVPACLLASARKNPAIWLDGPLDATWRDWLHQVHPEEIVYVARSERAPLTSDLPNCKIIRIETASAAFAAYESALDVPLVDHLVVLGPRPPSQPELRHFALLVPQYAVSHRAAVAVLSADEEIENQLHHLLSGRYASVRYVTLWGNAESIPDKEVEDPVAAAGMETKLLEKTFAVAPLSGLEQHQPCQYRVGRITGPSLSAVSLLVARNLRPFETRSHRSPRAVILANSDYELPLMEAITRTTAQTFEKSGWQLNARYGWRADWYHRPGQRWGADMVLYEGHTASLPKAVQFDPDRDPVVAGLYLFQGCKTLRQPEVAALIRNGAACVVGSTTNTYSASGSSLAKAYVDAMLLDQMDAGTSLMVARNFMLTLAGLKERRQHEQTAKVLRGGMTFTLWGDPTWKPPPSAGVPDSERVVAVRRGSQIDLKVPDTWSPLVEVEDYMAQIPVGAKLAGVYEWQDEDHAHRQLPPLYFAVVPLPDYAEDGEPMVTTKLARNRWASLWDARNRWLYLLVQGSAKPDREQGRTFNFKIQSAR